MSTIIVTGANGFVGRAFLSASFGSDCVVLPVPREGAVAAVGQVARDHPDRPLMVLNLAWPTMQAYASTRTSVASEGSAWARYRTWLAALAAAAAAAPGARFFGIGSGIEPYALGERPVLGEPYVTYGRRKSEARDILARTPGLRAVWLRLHFLFGPHEAPERFIPRLLRACRDGISIETGGLERRRHWLHVEDAARGLAQAVLSDAPQDWDITGAHAVSFGDIIRLVETIVDRPVMLHPARRRPADDACPYIAPNNVPPFMKGAIGSTASLADGLKRYMIWLDQQSE